AEYLGEKLSTALQYDQEQKEVIVYGLLGIIQFVIVLSLLLIFSSLFGTVAASLILSFSVSALRVHAGGAHLSSIWVCSLTGVVISVLMPTVFELLGVQNLSSNYLFYITNGILLLALWIVIVKAPVDSPNKPITKPEKIKKLKRKSIIVVLIYFVIGNFLAYKLLNVYLFCLLFGVMWQCFTMLKIGHTILGFFERLSNKKS
ncbi:MAG TPA: hypothetical protein DDZ89_03600, partial [Clostridiales bacterium]|nr:hypothetical protein [Clostridiales bacterium]